MTETSSDSPPRIDLHDLDFILGIAVGLALSGIESISRHFNSADYAWDRGMAEAYQWVRENRPDLDVRFHIILDRIYQDSQTAYTMLFQGIQTGLFHRDSDGDFVLEIRRDAALLNLKRLPFDEHEARTLADIVLSYYGG